MIPRHAPYEESADFTIGLKPIGEAAWLEGGETDPAARKDPLFATCREIVWGETPRSHAGQGEVLRLIDETLGPASHRPELPDLYAAARRTPDDLVLMEKHDGAWRVSALSLCAPTFFTAHDVLGRSLAEIHGPVHGFAERFLARVERIFEGLRPDLILERRNWSLVNSGQSFTPDPAPIRARIGSIDPADAGSELFVRVERQTLRRLPQTGGALFTIRVWLHPLDDLLDDPPRLAAFAKAWRAAPADFRDYKRLGLYDDLVEGFLRSHGAR